MLVNADYQLLYMNNCIGLDKVDTLIRHGKVTNARGFWIDKETFYVVRHDEEGRIDRFLQYPLIKKSEKVSLESCYALSKPIYLRINEVPNREKILDLCIYALIHLFSFVLIRDKEDMVDELREVIKQYTGWSLKVIPLKANPFK